MQCEWSSAGPPQRQYAQKKTRSRGRVADKPPVVRLRIMALDGEYEPSPWEWVRDQVDTYERTGGREANTLLDTGLPVILVTTRGNKSGKLRKTPLMRVEHDGEYALVASQGGCPEASGLVPQSEGRSRGGHHPGRPGAVRRTGPRGQRRRASRVVGTGGRRLPAVCRVPDEDRSADPRLRGRSARLSWPARG